MNYNYDKLYWVEENNPDVPTLMAEKINHRSVLILPTDTIYGLVGDASENTVRERIKAIKNRQHESFVVLLSSVAQLERLSISKIDEAILSLLPCPLTLIIDNGEERGLAVRIPQADKWIHQVLVHLKNPLIATSVNRSGSSHLETKEDLMSFYDEVDAIVLSSKKLNPNPSTILDVRKKPYSILRQGNYEVPKQLL